MFLYGSASQNWTASNRATVPTLLAAVAAAATDNHRVQWAALAVIMLMWAWYFETLQGALV